MIDATLFEMRAKGNIIKIVDGRQPAYTKRFDHSTLKQDSDEDSIVVPYTGHDFVDFDLDIDRHKQEQPKFDVIEFEDFSSNLDDNKRHF